MINNGYTEIRYLPMKFKYFDLLWSNDDCIENQRPNKVVRPLVSSYASPLRLNVEAIIMVETII